MGMTRIFFLGYYLGGGPFCPFHLNLCLLRSFCAG